MNHPYDVLDEVRTTYADTRLPFEQAQHIRRLRWRSEVALKSDDPRLAEALAAIGGYNAFDGNNVAAELRKYRCEVTIARESSVCLYVLPTGEGAITEALLRLKADEVDPQDDGTIRAWWD